jgi:putative hydrolase of the HAD superfamily
MIIAFDADDTLWQNEEIYARATQKFTRLLSPYCDLEEISRRLSLVEIENLSLYGYGIKSYALSMIEATVEISAGQISGQEMRQAVAIVKEMLEAEVLLLPHARETLERLSQKYIMMLITKGDQFEQARKIRRSGMAHYFQYIEITGEKTPESYQALLDKYGIEPQQFLMVGNSLKSDILPVLAIGGQAVYIPYENTWSHENVDEQELQTVTYGELQHLGQLPDYIAALERA